MNVSMPESAKPAIKNISYGKLILKKDMGEKGDTMTRIRLVTTDMKGKPPYIYRGRDVVAQFDTTVYMHSDGKTIDIHIPRDMVKTLRGEK